MYRKWTQEEINFLYKHYKIDGYAYCVINLSRTKGSIIKKAKNIGLSESITQKRETIYSKENLEKAIKKSYSYQDCIIELNILKKGTGYYKTIKKYIDLYEIDISHFDGYFKSKSLIDYRNNIKIPLEDILISNSKYNRSSLKKRLLNENIIENKCVLCGQNEEWNGVKISLILDHINGINDDNRLSNLRIVCPNCNAGLSTFAGRNIKNNLTQDVSYRKQKNINRKNFCKCGDEIEKCAIRCKKCHSLSTRKARPSYEELILSVKNNGYRATGRNYNVSDTTIKNWIVNYENTMVEQV